MKTVVELWDKAHDTYLRARSILNEADKRRLLSEADGYLKQADELRRGRKDSIEVPKNRN